MILKTMFIALAGVAAWKFAKGRQTGLPSHTLDRKPRAENRWENEGGALHQTGAQLGPEPSTVKTP